MPGNKRAGWNPVRRNKKIGTEDSGFKSRNKLELPIWSGNKVFWERLNDPGTVICNIGEQEIAFIAEAPLSGYSYHISIEDILFLLNHLPEYHREDICNIVFRQSKRKELLFSHCWGRLAYYGDFRDYGGFYGTTIIVEAMESNAVRKWSRNLDPDDQDELQALKNDGHRIVPVKRGFEIFYSPETIRNTKLYRTLIHEIGHHVDYLEKVLDAENPDDLNLSDLYFARPKKEREHFANRYAREKSEQLKKDGVIPFSPRPPSEKLYNKIQKDWFYFHKS